MILKFTKVAKVCNYCILSSVRCNKWFIIAIIPYVIYYYSQHCTWQCDWHSHHSSEGEGGAGGGGVVRRVRKSLTWEPANHKAVLKLVLFHYERTLIETTKGPREKDFFFFFYNKSYCKIIINVFTVITQNCYYFSVLKSAFFFFFYERFPQLLEYLFSLSLLPVRYGNGRKIK